MEAGDQRLILNAALQPLLQASTEGRAYLIHLLLDAGSCPGGIMHTQSRAVKLSQLIHVLTSSTFCWMLAHTAEQQYSAMKLYVSTYTCPHLIHLLLDAGSCPGGIMHAQRRCWQPWALSTPCHVNQVAISQQRHSLKTLLLQASQDTV
jgi:hypothetical protein